MTEFLLLSSLFAATLMRPAESDVPPPIQMIAQTTEDGVRIRVVGSSLEPVTAKYMLQVSSEGANSNRSTQRGSVKLVPGVEVTMVNMTLRSRGQSWTARLTVEAENAPAYEIVKTSA
jgi:hypothetical protein